MSLLDEKIELEHLWTKLYKKHGIYTTEMVPITERIKELTLQLIIQDREKMHLRHHNQAK